MSSIMVDATTRNFLPEKYWFAHAYCFFLHDILADIIVRGEQLEVFHHGFELRYISHGEEMVQKSGEELFEWMKRNGYEAELREATRRHICVALLADFCHFVYEALVCSQKGKLTVTYALLRKPLKENLFYFEWMLADPADFIERFHAPILDPTDRPLPNVADLKPDAKKATLEIISKAMNIITFASDFSAEFIHELRYDKKCPYGFEVLFQQANHLITTYSGATEEGNFNFIFSDDEARESQWNGLYTFLPTLLLHTVLVVTTVIQGFDEGKLEDVEFDIFRAIAGFIVYVNDAKWLSDVTSPLQDFAAGLTSLALPCLGCQEMLAFDLDNVRELYEEGIVRCNRCGYKTLLTSNYDLLVLAHIRQGRLHCPSCKSPIVFSEENAASFLKNHRVHCDHCQEEIDIVSADNSPNDEELSLSA